jgi:hypothetical protein
LGDVAVFLRKAEHVEIRLDDIEAVEPEMEDLGQALVSLRPGRLFRRGIPEEGIPDSAGERSSTRRVGISSASLCQTGDRARGSGELCRIEFGSCRDHLKSFIRAQAVGGYLEIRCT